MELARRLRAQEISARELVELHLEQLERTNPHTNAVARARQREARREADAADQRLAQGGDDLPPLLGVPCTIKESFSFTGMPHSAGLRARRDVIATEDATAVARLRAAGAIPLGVTNISELCMWMESVNPVYGRSRNPYDASRIVGGSSGGEAAAIASGVSPFGLGSDVGGSIRNPAYFNGIFGHKPSPMVVPNSGQYPETDGAMQRYLCSGPMTRRAEDLMPLLRILAGPDAQYPECASASQLGDPNAVSFEGRTLISIEGSGALPVAPELLRAQRRAAEHLVARGMELRVVELPALRRQFEIWASMMGLANEVPFGTLLGEGTPVSAWREMLKWSVGASDHTWMALCTAVTDPMVRRFPKRAKELAALGLQLKQEILALLGEGGLLLYPPYVTTAPRHRVPARWATRLHMPWSYHAIFNVLELPVTQVPLGLAQDGLPLGVQVVSAPMNDHLTIAAALELERAFGGWRPPALAGLS